jgi:hypothetical protein
MRLVGDGLVEGDGCLSLAHSSSVTAASVQMRAKFINFSRASRVVARAAR